MIITFFKLITKSSGLSFELEINNFNTFPNYPYLTEGDLSPGEDIGLTSLFNKKLVSYIYI